MQILSGDIGGTNCRLALYDTASAAPQLLARETWPSNAADGLEGLLGRFLQQTGATPQAACLALAGPVQGRSCRTTNLPWQVDADRLQHALGLPRVELLNDLEAAAWGLDALAPTDLVTLQPGAPGATGNRAVIAAGTGLGQAICCFDGAGHHPFATEGGHAVFAPGDALEFELLEYLQRSLEHVSWERVLSGPGLVTLHDFLQHRSGGTRRREAGEIARDAASDALCRQAMDWFFRLLAIEAGNLALKAMARGGVYIAGGVAPANRQWLERPEFLRQFQHKGRMSQLLADMPLHLVLNGELALLGPLVYLQRSGER